MKLLIYITNNVEHVYPILSTMMEHGMSATVVDSEGMLSAISQVSSEPPPMFGALRAFLNPTQSHGKMLFAALRDEEVKDAIRIIHAVAGDLHEANRGVLFTVPIDYSELTGK
ncbi:MAG: hypothetical protein IJS53_01595 [Clostridia bacterium]|nr:hypothetical protein [Clostridia bacterium]